MMFGDLTQHSSHFTGSRNTGFFDEGVAGVIGYSVDLNKLHKGVDESFDVMIKYGDVDTFEMIHEGYSKVGSSFQTLPDDSTYGLLGSGSVDGYYLSYCVGEDACYTSGRDYLNFTTHKKYPRKDYLMNSKKY